MNKKITLRNLTFLLLLCFIFFCPLFLSKSFSINTIAAKSEVLNVCGNRHLFIKTVLPGDSFKIIVNDCGKKLSWSDVTFSSQNKDVATVDKHGNLKSLKIGTAKIKVYTKVGHHTIATLNLKVKSYIPRVLFIGDSRTVYMFSEENAEILGDVRNNMYVYARGGAQVGFVKEVLDRVDPSTYDTVVTWMGANDRGHFGGYKKHYSRILKMKKKLVLCTVGPVRDYMLDEMGRICFNTGLMNKLNNDMKDWANDHDCEVVELYDYINQKRMGTADGVHYQGKANKKILNYLRQQLDDYDI